nr:hypothetical protein Itr_chr06CG07820 [Ipomoea trifida]
MSIAELHVAGECSKSVICTSRHIRHRNRSLKHHNSFLKPPQTAVNRRRDVQAHSQFQARLTVDRALLERLRSTESVVQRLNRALAGRNRVPRDLQ